MDTCTEKTANFCKVSKSRNRYKLPSLAEIYNILFGNDFDSAHNASADVCATARVFLELLRLGVINHDEIKEEDSFFTKFKEANPYVVQSANIEVISNESENSNEDTVEPESTANDIKHLSLLIYMYILIIPYSTACLKYLTSWTNVSEQA